MSTFREIVYMVLDANKLSNDDSYVEPEHVIFIVSKIRAFLVSQRYKTMKAQISNSDFQTICVDMEEVGDGTYCSSGFTVLKSRQKIPNLLLLNNYEGLTTIGPKNSFGINTGFSYVNPMRFESAGYSKWNYMSHYTTIGNDGYLYVKSQNSDINALDTLQVRAVFEDIESAAKMSCPEYCNDDGNTNCDFLDKEFPLEEGLITPLIDTAVNFFNNMSIKQQDIKNSSDDELSSIAAYLNTIIKERYRNYQND